MIPDVVFNFGKGEVESSILSRSTSEGVDFIVQMRGRSVNRSSPLLTGSDCHRRNATGTVGAHGGASTGRRFYAAMRYGERWKGEVER